MFIFVIGWKQLAISCWTPPPPVGWGCTNCWATTRTSCQKGLGEPVMIYAGLRNKSFQFLFCCFRLTKRDVQSLLFSHSDQVPEELGWMSFICLLNPFCELWKKDLDESENCVLLFRRSWPWVLCCSSMGKNILRHLLMVRYTHSHTQSYNVTLDQNMFDTEFSRCCI